jgi:hypothetical protein
MVKIRDPKPPQVLGPADGLLVHQSVSTGVVLSSVSGPNEAPSNPNNLVVHLVFSLAKKTKSVRNKLSASLIHMILMALGKHKIIVTCPLIAGPHAKIYMTSSDSYKRIS